MATAFALRRDGQAARATWEIEPEMGGNEYVAWVKPRLAEYRIAENGPDALRFTRPLSGDVYSLVLRPRRDGGRLAVEAAFESSPF